MISTRLAPAVVAAALTAAGCTLLVDPPVARAEGGVLADPPQPDLCRPDDLAALRVAGLSPAFSPSATDYRAPTPSGGAVLVTAAPCDAAVTVFANGVPLRAGEPASVWVGDGRALALVRYRGWTEVGRTSVTFSAELPAPPPPPVVAGLFVAGLTRPFDPAVTHYTVAPPAGDRLPLTVAVADPAIDVYVQSQRVRPGRAHHAWAPPGQRVDIVAYRGWTEVSRYVLDVLADAPPPHLDLHLYPDGVLYLSGGTSVVLLDLHTGDTETVQVPSCSSTLMLAASDDDARVYVSCTGAEASLAALSTASHAVVDQRVFAGGSESPGALTVAPGSTLVHVAPPISGVLETLDAADLSGPAQLELIPGVSQPMLMGYRPGSLDLYVSDFWTGPEQLVVRRPFIDWEASALEFGWSTYEMLDSATNEDGSSGAGFAFLPEAGWIVAANSRGDEVVVFDEVTHVRLARASAAAMPFHVTLQPGASATGGRVFVVSLQAPSVTVYDVGLGATGGVELVQGKRWNPCPTGHYPVEVVFGSKPQTAYVSCGRSVVAFDTLSLETTQVFEVPGDSDSDALWSPR